MTREEFSKIASTIPHQPGCYKYYDVHSELLYVGKAKDIRKRVGSYFHKAYDNYKTQRLVSLIHKIDYTVTNTEHDAFLLENSGLFIDDVIWPTTLILLGLFVIFRNRFRHNNTTTTENN